MKWWSILLCVGLLLLALVLIYEKIASDRAISQLDDLSESLRDDNERMAGQLELLRAEADTSSATIAELRDENQSLRKQLAASLERSAVLETILDDSAIVTEGLAGEIDDASRLVEEVIGRIKIDRAAIERSVD